MKVPLKWSGQLDLLNDMTGDTMAINSTRLKDCSSLSSKPLEEVLFGEPLPDFVSRLSYIRRLERTWQLIAGKHDDPRLSLQCAAKTVGVSQNHLNILLRGVTSLTFHQLLIRYRLLRATEMMKAKNYSIIDVALANGFGSLNAFERNFRIIFGVTPIEFKMSHCGSRTPIRIESAQKVLDRGQRKLGQ